MAGPLVEWRRVTQQLARGRAVADDRWAEMCHETLIEWFDRWVSNAKQQAEEREVRPVAFLYLVNHSTTWLAGGGIVESKRSQKGEHSIPARQTACRSNG